MFFFIKFLVTVIFLLLSVAFFTVLERKLIASIQRRKGPNVIGFWGTLQAFSDGLKLFLKEIVLPSSSSKKLFIFAPVFSFFLSLLSWAVVPFSFGVVFSNLNLGLLFLFAISSLGVYGVIFAGWSSNSKYAFLGSLRSAAQIISYEVSLGFIIVSVILCSGSLNLTSIVLSQERVWFCIPLFPLFLLFFISALAETNRHPFDLPEAEAELVSGYNVEYSAITFALFFLGEYNNIILISSLTTILFCGGWLSPFGIISPLVSFSFKSFIFICLFIWVRAAFPRYRYDQLMRLGWQVFLPFSIGWILFASGVLISFNWLPLLKITYMVINLSFYLFVSIIIFFIGALGIMLNRRSLILVLVCIELILLSVNLNFVFFSFYIDDFLGQLFVLYILTVAASESAIGLAILVVYFRVHNNISSEGLRLLHGLIIFYKKTMVSFKKKNPWIISFSKWILRILGSSCQGIILKEDLISIFLKKSSVTYSIVFFKNHSNCLFKTLSDLSCSDFLIKDSRIEIVYNLLSKAYSSRILVKVRLSSSESIASISNTFSSACWFEREAFDLFGIFFVNNPDLRRLLTDYGFEGNPLKKDFPLYGFTEVRFDFFKKRVVCDLVKLSQSYRSIKFNPIRNGYFKLSFYFS